MFCFSESLDGKEIQEMERRFLMNWKASRAARKKSNERMTDEQAAYVQFCKQNESIISYLLKIYRNHKIAAKNKYFIFINII